MNDLKVLAVKFLFWLLDGVSRLRRAMMPAPLALLEIGSGAWPAMCLATVAKLGLADELSGGPKSCPELAEALGLHAPSFNESYAYWRPMESFVKIAMAVSP